MEHFSCESLNGALLKPTSGGCKQSDFSIDHILNKAGDGEKKCDNQRLNVKDFSELSGMNRKMIADNNDQYMPMLNWLNYTRYRPPKLPS